MTCMYMHMQATNIMIYNVLIGMMCVCGGGEDRGIYMQVPPVITTHPLPIHVMDQSPSIQIILKPENQGIPFLRPISAKV